MKFPYLDGAYDNVPRNPEHYEVREELHSAPNSALLSRCLFSTISLDEAKRYVRFRYDTQGEVCHILAVEHA